MEYDFPVEMRKVFDQNGNEIKGKMSVVRTDTSTPLSIVSDRYKIIEHKKILDVYAKPLVRNMGMKHNEHIYVEKNGAVMNYSVDFPGIPKRLAEVGDAVQINLIFRNSYDGSSSARIFIGAKVLSCKNGMVSSKHLGGLNASHTTAGAASIDEVTLDSLQEAIDKTIQSWNALGNIKISQKALVERMIPDLLNRGIIVKKTAAKVLARMPQTAWQLLQEITYDNTHSRTAVKGFDRRATLMTDTDRWFNANLAEA